MINMKKAVFAALAILLFAGFAFASVNPKMELLNYSVSENPAMPGHVIALTLYMKSIEPDNCAQDVAVQLAVAYPLSVEGSDTQYVSSLCSSDPASKGTFTFLIPVDNLATTGTYPVSISTTYDKAYTDLSASNTVNIVVGGEPSFTAHVTSSNPVDIYPGDNAQVTVTFQNTGPSNVQSAYASATASGIEMKWAGSDQGIGQIAARGSASAVFSIDAPKNLAAGSYPLNVQLNYNGEDGSNGTANFTFMVVVKPQSQFVAADLSPALLPGDSKEVTIAITNTGSQVADKMEVYIEPYYPFSTDGTVRYIEALQPGETQNLTYVITVDKDATSGGQLLTLLVNYQDPQGNDLSDTADFSMPVRLMTEQESIYSYWYLYVIVAVIALIVIAGRLRGRKKEAS